MWKDCHRVHVLIHTRACYTSNKTKTKQERNIWAMRCCLLVRFLGPCLFMFFSWISHPILHFFFQLTTTRRKMNNDVRKEEVAEEKDARRNTENSKVKFPLFYQCFAKFVGKQQPLTAPETEREREMGGDSNAAYIIRWRCCCCCCVCGWVSFAKNTCCFKLH